MDKNEVLNGLYTAALITTAAVGVNMVIKKLTGQSLAVPTSLKETAKLGAAIALGSFTVKYAQEKGYIPKVVEPEKKKE